MAALALPKSRRQGGDRGRRRRGRPSTTPAARRIDALHADEYLGDERQRLAGERRFRWSARAAMSCARGRDAECGADLSAAETVWLEGLARVFDNEAHRPASRGATSMRGRSRGAPPTRIRMSRGDLWSPIPADGALFKRRCPQRETTRGLALGRDILVVPPSVIAAAHVPASKS